MLVLRLLDACLPACVDRVVLRLLVQEEMPLLLSPLLLLSAAPEPGVLRFTRMWISSDGHTHLQDCTIQNMTRSPLPGGKVSQYVRDLKGVVDPTQLIFTQFPAKADNPWHQCPTAQFVIPMSGSWRVNTSDGDWLDMGPGHVLYQDDYNGLMVSGIAPVHYSSSVDGCNQLVVSAASRKAAIDDRSCDWTQQWISGAAAHDAVAVDGEQGMEQRRLLQLPATPMVSTPLSTEAKRTLLRKLGRQYGTDKRIHGFLDLYSERLPPRAEVSHLLEVGVYYGASIQMWRDYYAAADIYGLDSFLGVFGNGNVWPNATKFQDEVRAGMHGPRVHLLVADQASEEQMGGVVAKLERKRLAFDVILEDGSHKSRDQQLNLAQVIAISRHLHRISPRACI